MAVGAAALMAGCGDGAYALPADAPQLEQATYVNENDKEDTYNAIMYGGREYVCYGTLGGSFRDKEVEACIGYTGSDRNERVCTLRATKDYIMQTYVNGVMDQPVFYRAADTLGKDIYTPDYIDSLDHELWQSDDAKEGRS